MDTSFEISLDDIGAEEFEKLGKLGFDLEHFCLTLRNLETVLSQQIFNFTKLSKEKIEHVEVSLQIVGINEITKINNDYRNKNKETDVISLSMYEDLRKNTDEAITPYLSLGDIIICADVACAQAGESNLDIETELVELIIHGLLHLCGFDHEINEEEMEKMYQWERKLFEEVKGNHHE